MRREMKLLLIEIERLRSEVERLRASEAEARKTQEFLSADVNRIMASRDQWQGEAERLGALMTSQVSHWSQFWSKAADRWHTARASQCWLNFRRGLFRFAKLPAVILAREQVPTLVDEWWKHRLRWGASAAPQGSTAPAPFTHDPGT